MIYADPTPMPSPELTSNLTPTPTPTPIPGAGGSMYVWSIDFGLKAYGPGGSFKDILTTVTVRSDSDGDGVASSSDVPLLDATVLMTITYDFDGDGVFECGGDNSCWNFGSTTGSTGEVTFTLKRAPLGNYQESVTDMSHSSLTYDPGLDTDNPDTFNLQ